MKTTSPSATASKSLHQIARGVGATLLCAAVLWLTPVPAWAKRTLVANASQNAFGGTLYVSGTGWKKTGKITISVTNPPQQKPGTYKILTGSLDNGKFNFQIEYWFSLGGACPFTNPGQAFVQVNAADGAKRLSRSVEVQNCLLVWE